MAAKPQPEPFHFEGYDSPNYTPVPDQLFDEHLALLSGAELKALLYICRRTFGFKRDSDNISLNQMLHGIVTRDGRRLDAGTGLSKPALISALKSLIEKNIVVAQQRSSAEKGNEATNYRLNIRTPLVKKIDQGELNNFTPLGKKTLPGLVKKFDQAPGKKTLPTINSSTTNSITRNSNNNNIDESSDDSSLHTNVVVVLTSLGIAQKVAQKLAVAHTEEYLREKIDFLEFLQAERPEEVQKPAGWLRKAIEDNYGRPDGYKSSAERLAEAAEAARQAQAAAAHAQAAQAQATERAAHHAAWLEQVHDQYGTTAEDLVFWAKAQEELKFASISHPDLKTLLAGAEILQYTGTTVQIGIPREASFRQLGHPGTRKVIQRALTQAAGRPVEPEFVLVTKPREGESQVVGDHPHGIGGNASPVS